jgi:restriction endonuclease Mrr
VREQYGVVEQERASHGVIATTSSFTKHARAFHEQLTYRLSLTDFNKLVEWLREHKRRR